MSARQSVDRAIGDVGIVDPQDAAESAGLAYVNDEEPGIRRRKSGRGFSYRGPDGKTIRDRATLARIRALAIPPAYTDVWICPDPAGHLQATGRDARGRKQYRYHPRFREVRESTKFEHMLAFAQALPAIRARVDADMRRPGLPRERVIATIVHLLETTLIRVGNEDYARDNRSYGLTTLEERHLEMEGAGLRFVFSGKGGKEWNIKLRDRRVARVLRALQDLPGQRLFQYRDAEGARASVDSADVNAYLREASGGLPVTAKDFRTWGGTVLAALALQELESFESERAAKSHLKDAIARVAARLGNTPTICRKCYVHPEITAAFLSGELAHALRNAAEAALTEEIDGLAPEEAAVAAMLRARLSG